MSEKLCVFCHHFYLDAGEPGYSEYTPGIDAELRCNKGHWEMQNNVENSREFRAAIQRAKTCKDYEEARDG